MSSTSRENKEAAFYHGSDAEPTKIRPRSHLSPSVRYRGGKGSSYKAWWGDANSKVRIGPSNRPRPDERMADEVLDEHAITLAHTRHVMGTIDQDDETRYWPWMTDMEKEWQPPVQIPQIDLLAMAKPNKRKRRPLHHTLPNSLVEHVLDLDDELSVVTAGDVESMGVFSDYGSESEFGYHEVIDGLEWEDVGLDLDYVGETLEESSAGDQADAPTHQPRLSYAQALSIRNARLAPSR